MSLMLSGVGIAKGVAIGRAYVMKQGQTEIPEYEIPEYLLDEEVDRYNHAIKQVREQLTQIREQISAQTSEDITEFVESHIITLDENAISRAPVRIIREQKINAEWALKQQRDNLVKVFEDIDEPYLNTRKNDIDMVVDSVLKALKQQEIEPIDDPDENGMDRIIIVDRISPSDLALINSDNLAGIVSEHDAPSSHTAIMARSLGIPAITGIDKARNYVSDGDKIIIDGKFGTICVDPDDISADYYCELAQDINQYKESLNILCNEPSVTRDEHKVSLCANIEMLTELEQMQKCGAECIGLFRTEYLFMNRDQLPDEEEQYEHYVKIVNEAAAIPVNIRTLDIGADKQLPGIDDNSKHTNPMLGLRAIRFSLAHPEIFIPQIRAILRAGVHGSIGILLPMVGNTTELDQALAIIKQQQRELTEAGQEIGEITIGIMIETPAAALMIEYFVKQVDFIAIGTNDLTQYMLAIDRSDDKVSQLFDSSHPSVLQTINNIIKVCNQQKRQVLVCGEMAGDKKYTRLLLGMGLRNFSMIPSQLLEIKKHIRNSRIDDSELFINEILKNSRPERIEELINRLNQ